MSLPDDFEFQKLRVEPGEVVVIYSEPALDAETATYLSEVLGGAPVIAFDKSTTFEQMSQAEVVAILQRISQRAA